MQMTICTEWVWVATYQRPRTSGVMRCPRGDDVAGDDAAVRELHDEIGAASTQLSVDDQRKTVRTLNPKPYTMHNLLSLLRT